MDPELRSIVDKMLTRLEIEIRTREMKGRCPSTDLVSSPVFMRGVFPVGDDGFRVPAHDFSPITACAPDASHWDLEPFAID
jgi:hypothetical protein